MSNRQTLAIVIAAVAVLGVIASVVFTGLVNREREGAPAGVSVSPSAKATQPGGGTQETGSAGGQPSAVPSPGVFHLTPGGADLNILLVSIDTVRADHLKGYGYQQDTSPNLTKLSAKGVTYMNAYSQAPWTLVSHMSVFTSLFPSTHKVESINERLSRNIPTLPELMKEAGWETAAFVNNGQMKPHWGFARGFDLWKEFEVVKGESTADEGRAENITNNVVSWLRDRTAKPNPKKFFLFVHYFDAHDPYDPPAPYDTMFKPMMDMNLSGAQTAAVLQQYRAKGAALPDPALVPKLISLYDGEIAYLDHHLGRLFDALDELKLAPNTLVIVFGDHGEEFREHGSLLHGGTLYKEVLRVPLIMVWPGHLAPGAQAPQPARLIDILPSILKACELPTYPQSEGLSLVPPEYNANRFPDFELRAETKALLEGSVLKSITRAGLKYIYSPISRTEELYNLGMDPGEQTNLAPGSPQIAELRADMEKWMNRTEDYWMLTLDPGEGYATFSGTLELDQGVFGVVVPAGFSLFGDDGLTFNEELSRVQFSASAKGAPKVFYFQTGPADAPVKFTLKIDEQEASADKVRIETAGPEQIAGPMPLTLELSKEALPPFQLSAPARQGGVGPSITISKFRSPEKPADEQAPEGGKPDEGLMKQLQQLGYMQ